MLKESSGGEKKLSGFGGAGFGMGGLSQIKLTKTNSNLEMALSANIPRTESKFNLYIFFIKF